MVKRSLSVQLDEVVQAMLVSLRPRPEKAPDRELASLMRVAQGLHDLPREEFRAALKSDLQRRASMSESTAANKDWGGEGGSLSAAGADSDHAVHHCAARGEVHGVPEDGVRRRGADEDAST